LILYSQLLDDVIADLARTVDRFQCLDPERIIAVAASRAAGGKYGSLAECVALGLEETPTFEFSYDPKARRLLSATPWFVPRNRRVVVDGRRALYLLRFRFPRFLKHSPVESVVHELLHVSQRCDGTHRSLRHGRWFDRYVHDVERQWRRAGDPTLVSILDLDFNGLQERFGAVACRCFRRPFRTPLRLPDSREGDWGAHPDVQRLGLTVDPGRVRPMPLKFDDPAGLELTEGDFEHRVFHARGSERIAAELVRSHPDWEGVA
jgi:hypothetical protein